MQTIPQQFIEIHTIQTQAALRRRLWLLLAVLAAAVLALVWLSQAGPEVKKNGFAVLLPFAVFGICLVDAIYLLAEYRKAKALDDNGTRVQVVLKQKYRTQVSIFTNNVRYQSGNRKLPLYFLQYNLPNGMTVKSAVPRKVYEAVKTGRAMQVAYLADEPDIQRVEPEPR